MFIYSAKNNAFYNPEWKEDYEKAGSWPDDPVEVDDEIFTEFSLNNPPQGLHRAVGKDGLPCWEDLPPPTTEDSKKDKEYQIAKKTSQAQNRINVLQYSEDLDMATEKEKTTLKELKKYVVLLNRVPLQENYPFNVEWPKEVE